MCCLCGVHSILIFGLRVVTTILIPFCVRMVLCMCMKRKNGIVTCGISKQAIINIVCTEWSPSLRAAFEDIVPNSVGMVTALFLPAYFRSMTFYGGWYS